MSLKFWLPNNPAYVDVVQNIGTFVVVGSI